MRLKELERLLGDVRISLGPGMEFALEGDTVECISRKESTFQKNTAKLTVGQTYKITEIRFYGRADKKYCWGYVTVINDNGSSRSYPPYRFAFPKGVQLAMSQGVRLCPYCCRRKIYLKSDPIPSCSCIRSKIGDISPSTGIKMWVSFNEKSSNYRIDMKDLSGFAVQKFLSLYFVEQSTPSLIQDYLMQAFLDAKRSSIYQLQENIMGYVPPRFPPMQAPEFRREFVGEWFDDEINVDTSGSPITPKMFDDLRERLTAYRSISTPVKTVQKERVPPEEPLMPRPGQRKINL